jgi:hypothetical protein
VGATVRLRRAATTSAIGGTMSTKSTLAIGLMFAVACAGCGGGSSGGGGGRPSTRTPIKHLIVVIPENRSFDNVFATYAPPAGQTIRNLLSLGIVNADGTPGPNLSTAAQMQATNTATYSIAPAHAGLYDSLPPPGLRLALSLPPGLVFPMLIPDPGLDATSQELLSIGSLTYSTPASTWMPDPLYSFQCLGQDFDTRYPSPLPNGPYQITGPTTPYVSYFGDPPHRFFQNWQQMDCSIANATASNPSGCLADLFA